MSEPTATTPDSLTARLRETLMTGCTHFGLDFGIVSQVKGNDYLVIAQVSPEEILKDGQRFPFSDTYCGITLGAGDVVAISHMSESAYCGHPCYDVFKLQTYIGIPLRVNGVAVGTLNFSSPLPYPREFTGSDKEFMRRLAATVDAAAVAVAYAPAA